MEKLGKASSVLIPFRIPEVAWSWSQMLIRQYPLIHRDAVPGCASSTERASEWSYFRGSIRITITRKRTQSSFTRYMIRDSRILHAPNSVLQSQCQYSYVCKIPFYASSATRITAIESKEPFPLIFETLGTDFIEVGKNCEIQRFVSLKKKMQNQQNDDLKPP